MYKGWYNLKNYDVYGFQRPLYLRYANTADDYASQEKSKAKNPNNKYGQYE